MRLLPLLCTLALTTAAMLPSVQAAWVTEFDKSDCTSPLNSVGNVPTGVCTRICSNGGCWGSQIITCNSDFHSVHRFYSDDCSGTAFSHANTTEPQPQGDTCLKVWAGTHSYKVSCEDNTPEQLKRVTVQYYSDATCETPIYETQGPEYAFSDVGTCFETNDSPAQSEGTYCSADGTEIHAYTFDGAGCDKDSWKALRYYEADKCEATSVNGQTVYTKTSCPGATYRGAAPPATWPPAGAAIGFVCATGDCSSGCTARVANRLGFCFAFDGEGSFSRMGCTADGSARGLAVHADNQCATPMLQTFLEPTHGGKAQCNGKGEYNTCPSQVATTNPKAVFEIPDAAIWEAQFTHDACVNTDFNHATLYVPDACIYHQFTVNIVPAEDGSGNVVQWTMWDAPECTGAGTIVRSIPMDTCDPSTSDNYASTSWTSPIYPSPNTFVLPPAPPTSDPATSSTGTGPDSAPTGSGPDPTSTGTDPDTTPTGDDGAITASSTGINTDPDGDLGLLRGAAHTTANVSILMLLIAFVAQRAMSQ